MLLNPTILRIVGLAAALTLSVAAPGTLAAAPAHHHAAKHATAAAAGESSDSCWKMTDSDHHYGYSVPCSEPGALHR